MIVNPQPHQPVEGRMADVVCAAHTAAEVAVRLIKQGSSSRTVVDAINAVAAAFRVKSVAGTRSYLMKRFLLESEEVTKNNNRIEDGEKKTPPYY